MALTPGTFDGTQMLQLMMPPCYMKFLDDRLVIGASPGAVNRYLKATLPKQPQGPAGALAVRADLGLLTTSYPEPTPGGKLYITLVRKGRDVVLTAGYAGMRSSTVSRFYGAYMATALAWMIPMRASVQYGEASHSAGGGNLQQIGVAISMYRAEHKGQYPPSLEKLVQDAYLPGAQRAGRPGGHPSADEAGRTGPCLQLRVRRPPAGQRAAQLHRRLLAQGHSPRRPRGALRGRLRGPGLRAGPAHGRWRARLLPAAAVRLADGPARRRVHRRAEGGVQEVLRGGRGNPGRELPPARRLPRPLPRPRGQERRQIWPWARTTCT